MFKPERRYAELRAEGRLLSGVVVRYGEVARLDFGQERILAGAFAPVGDVILNAMHDRQKPLARTGGGGLTFTDSADALRMAADMPETREAADTLKLVRSGVLRGLSIEFHAMRERQDAGVRVIERAHLVGLGVVDRPAYKDSTVAVRSAVSVVELRAGGYRVSGSVPYGQPKTISDRGRTRKQSLEPGAISWQLREFGKLQEELAATVNRLARQVIAEKQRDVTLSAGRTLDRPLASMKSGTLRVRESATAIEFDADLPATLAAKELATEIKHLDGSAGVDVLFRIPPADVVPNAVTIEPEAGNPGVQVERVNHAILTGIAIMGRAPRGRSGELKVSGGEPRRRFLGGRFLWR